MSRTRVARLALSAGILITGVVRSNEALALPGDPTELVPSWTALYDATRECCVMHGAQALTLSPDGSRIYVTGAATDDVSTVAYSAIDGTQLWAAGFPSGGATAIAVSPDGTRVFATGPTGGYNLDYATVAYDAATGSQLWDARHSASGNYSYDVARDLIVSPDGTRLYVTGQSSAGATIAYDVSDGSEVWTGSKGGSDLDLSPDGERLYVSGAFTVAYDTGDGSQVWSAAGCGADCEHGAVVASPRGTLVFMAGELDGLLTVRAFDVKDGSQRWVERYEGRGEGGVALATSPYGTRVYVAGSLSTLAYDAGDGALLWMALAAPREIQREPALVVSPDGARVYRTSSGYDGYGRFFIFGSCIGLCDVTASSTTHVYRSDGVEQAAYPFAALWAGIAVSADGQRLFAAGSIDQYNHVTRSTGSYATVAFCTYGAVSEIGALHPPFPSDCLTRT